MLTRLKYAYSQTSRKTSRKCNNFFLIMVRGSIKIPASMSLRCFKLLAYEPVHGLCVGFVYVCSCFWCSVFNSNVTSRYECGLCIWSWWYLLP